MFALTEMSTAGKQEYASVCVCVCVCVVQVSVDVDAALNTAHDFLARAARDLHKKSARG